MMLHHLIGPSGFVLGVEANPLNAMIAQAQCTLNGIPDSQVK